MADRYNSWFDIRTSQQSYLRDSLIEYYRFIQNNSFAKKKDLYIYQNDFLNKIISRKNNELSLKEKLPNYDEFEESIYVDTIRFFVLFLCCKDFAHINEYIVNINDDNLFVKNSNEINDNSEDEDSLPDFYKEFRVDFQNILSKYSSVIVEPSIDKYDKEKEKKLRGLLNPFLHKSEFMDELKVFTSTNKEFLYNDIHSVLDKLINERIENISKALYPEINIEKNFFLAVGDGSETAGLFDITNLGVVFFHYIQYIDKKYRIYNFTIPICPFAKVQLATWGYDFATKTKFQFSIREKSKVKFVAKKYDNERYYYEPITPILKKGDIYYFVIGTFYRTKKNYNTLMLKNKERESLIFSITPSYEKNNNLIARYEECMFVISVTNPEPRSKEDITLTISKSDTFDNDKFEVEKDKIDGLFRDKIEQKKLLYLIDLLKEADETNQWSFNTPSLCGKFVGTENKYAELGEPKITADIRYIPTNETIENKSDETDISQERAYRDLRYSYFKLTTNVEEKKIDIEIESFVSPLISRLDKAYELLDYRATQDSLPPDFELPAEPKIPTSCINELTLQNYKVEGVNWHADNPQTSPKIEIPSYNQALAMLRSFGLLEAFVIRIRTVMEENMSAYSQEEYERVISKLRNLLVYQAVSYDKTAEARGIDTKYQLSENQCVTYGLYQSLKWYCYPLQKKDASPYQYDYERYYRFEW